MEGSRGKLPTTVQCPSPTSSPASAAQLSPTQFNGKYSSEMHREVPKTRRSAFVIKNKNVSEHPKVNEILTIHEKDKNAKELVEFIGKIENRRRKTHSCSISEVLGMDMIEPSVDDVIAQRESKRVSTQMPPSLEDSRRKELKKCQQLILYLRHASSCQNEHCTVST